MPTCLGLVGTEGLGGGQQASSVAATGPDHHVAVLAQDDVVAAVVVEHRGGAQFGGGTARLGDHVWLHQVHLAEAEVLAQTSWLPLAPRFPLSQTHSLSADREGGPKSEGIGPGGGIHSPQDHVVGTQCLVPRDRPSSLHSRYPKGLHCSLLPAPILVVSGPHWLFLGCLFPMNLCVLRCSGNPRYHVPWHVTHWLSEGLWHSQGTPK